MQKHLTIVSLVVVPIGVLQIASSHNIIIVVIAIDRSSRLIEVRLVIVIVVIRSEKSCGIARLKVGLLLLSYGHQRILDTCTNQ